MDNITEHPDGQRTYVTLVSLLAAMTEHAEEASLGDFGLYLRAAEMELSRGPWWPASAVSVERVAIAEAVDLLLNLLEELRQQTNDEVGIVAVAAARLWVIDGVRYLDRLVADVANRAAEARATSGRVDLVWQCGS